MLKQRRLLRIKTRQAQARRNLAVFDRLNTQVSYVGARSKVSWLVSLFSAPNG